MTAETWRYRGQDTRTFASTLRASGGEVRLRDWYAGAHAFTYK